MKRHILFAVQDGKIKEEKERIKKLFILTDGMYSLTIETEGTRTLEQNAYYWKVCVPLVKQGLRDLGYDEVKSNYDAHEVMKHLFLKRQIVNKQTGEVLSELAGSTTELDKEQFTAYLEDIYKWAASYLGIVIPEPEIL